MDQTLNPIENVGGRYYIRCGFSGSNTRANNLNGYATEAKALAVHKRCGGNPPVWVRYKTGAAGELRWK